MLKRKDDTATDFHYSESDIMDSLNRFAANELRKLDLTKAEILEVVAEIAPEDVEMFDELLSE